MSSKNSKQFECNECMKNFTKKNNLNDHILAKHSNVEKYECSVCKKSFSYKQSLNRHMNGHKLSISVYSCSECGYSSQLKFMLTRHIKSVHLKENENVLNVSCVFCNHHCSKSNLCSHYMLRHQTEIISEKLKFDSLDAFYAWKYEVEDQDISRFVKARTTYVGKSGSKHLFFKCHRDGKYKPKGKNIRKLKSLGTNKIGSHCPARMDVKVEGNEVSVLYIKTHVGHDLEPKRLTLAKNEKDFLAEQLIMLNTNYDDILCAVKTLDSSSRLHHLTKKDLITIKSSLKGTAKKNNTVQVTEKSDKPNDTIEINNVFDDDLVDLFNVQNNEKSPLILNSENQNVELKSNKQDLMSVNNNLLTTNHIDIRLTKDSYTNKILYAVKTLDSSRRLHHLTKKNLVTIKSSLKGTAKKNNAVQVTEKSDKPNDTIEINNVFDDDLVDLFNVQNNEKSPLILNSENQNVELKSNKQDLMSVNNNLLTPNHIDIRLTKDSYTNKIEPMYELNVEQIIEPNEQIPILEFNPELLEGNQVIDYQQELTNIENERLSIMEKMKLIVNQITCNDEFAIVHQGLMNIMSIIDERRSAIDQAVVNGDLDNIMIFDESILQK